MAVDLYFFMRKRGLTIDKIIQKHNVIDIKHFISVMTKLGVDVPKTAYDAIELALVERTAPFDLQEEVLESDANIIVPHAIEMINQSRKKKKGASQRQDT